jgi:hypothetical protein
MVERFQYKKSYLLSLYFFVVFMLLASIAGFWQYFFNEDESIFLLLFIVAGISAAGVIYSIIEFKNYFVEISEDGIKTNKAEFTWDMIKSVNPTQKGIIIFFIDGNKKKGRIGFGSLIEGCDYAKSLVTKYTTQKEAKNG